MGVKNVILEFNVGRDGGDIPLTFEELYLGECDEKKVATFHLVRKPSDSNTFVVVYRIECDNDIEVELKNIHLDGVKHEGDAVKWKTL